MSELVSRPVEGWGPNHEEYVELLQLPATPEVWRRMQEIRGAALTMEDFENFLDQSLAEMVESEQKPDCPHSEATTTPD